MKKINIFTLLLIMLLILSGCAVREEMPTETPAAAVTEAPVIVSTEAPTELPQPVAVEITLENWEEYFELRETEQVYISESCAVINRVFGYGVFLKEEYADRFANESNVAFDLEYNVAWARVMGDLTADNYLIIGSQTNEERKTQSAVLTDFRLAENMSEESDFFNQVASEFAFDSEFGA